MYTTIVSVYSYLRNKKRLCSYIFPIKDVQNKRGKIKRFPFLRNPREKGIFFKLIKKKEYGKGPVKKFDEFTLYVGLKLCWHNNFNIFQ